MMRVRASATPRPCVGTGAGNVGAWLMFIAVAPVAVVKGRRPRGGGRLGWPGRVARSHRVFVFVLVVVEQVCREQHCGSLRTVLPPMLHAELLDRDLAGLLLDRDRAVAGVFVDLARDDVDEGRPVLVAVPRHHPAWLHDELAQPQA